MTTKTAHEPADAGPGGRDDLDSGVLARLRSGGELHMDHYGGARLPFACLGAAGVVQRFARLEGPDAGAVFEVLDASGGYASACLGAAHPVVGRALREAVERSGYVTDEVGSLDRSLLLDSLFGRGGLWAEQFPPGEYHVSGRNSGSEGVELALRLVLESRFDRRNLKPKAGSEGRRKILAFEGAWHGWTGGVLSLLNRRHYRVGLPSVESAAPAGVEVTHLPFGEPEILEGFFAEHGGALAAVIVEPIQGDAGILVPPPGYLRRLSELCREHGALLVADEVLTFAKTGRFFAMSDDDGPVHTDITVIGKSLGMGAVSTSMVIARRGLDVRPSGAVSTSDLRPLTCSLISAGLGHIVQEGLLERSRALGEQLRSLLRAELVARFPRVYREVRGAGFLNGVELTEEAAPALARLRAGLIEHGVYVEFMAGAGRRSKGLRYLFPAMRVAPPLISSEAEVARIIERVAAGTEAFAREALSS